jgi:hypothetical protein
MKKTDGKTKSAGGLKDISECRTKKLDEPTTAVSVKVIINGKENLISLNDFKALLFDDVKEEPIVKLSGAKKVLSSFYDLVDTPDNKEYRELYGQSMLIEFADYWTEMLPSGKKQRWQKERAFDIGRRLKTWAKRDYSGHWRKHKEDRINKEQEEYYKKASERAEQFMSPEEQSKEIKRLTKGLFKRV